MLGKMLLLILQLFIISAFASTMNRYPPTKRSTEAIMTEEEKNQRELENTLYCAVESLYNAGGQLSDVNFTLPLFTQSDISNNTKENMNRTLRHFSDRCKYFTTAMTLKHQLQYHLFFIDTTPNLNSDNAKRLSTILTSLQTMADVFNDMEFNKNNRICILLTPAQYEIVYHLQHSTPLLESLEDLNVWYQNRSLYEYPDVRHC